MLPGYSTCALTTASITCSAADDELLRASEARSRRSGSFRLPPSRPPISGGYSHRGVRAPLPGAPHSLDRDTSHEGLPQLLWRYRPRLAQDTERGLDSLPAGWIGADNSWGPVDQARRGASSAVIEDRPTEAIHGTRSEASSAR